MLAPGFDMKSTYCLPYLALQTEGGSILASAGWLEHGHHTPGGSNRNRSCFGGRRQSFVQPSTMGYQRTHGILHGGRHERGRHERGSWDGDLAHTGPSSGHK